MENEDTISVCLKSFFCTATVLKVSMYYWRSQHYDLQLLAMQNLDSDIHIKNILCW